MRFAILIVLAVKMPVCGLAPAADPYFTLVGVRPGATHSYVTALSFNGDVAVGRMEGDFTQYLSFRWSRAEGRTEDMIPAGFSEYEYRDVSDDGRSFVGGARQRATDPQTMLLSRDGVESIISSPLGLGLNTRVISGDGSAAGGSIVIAPGLAQGFVWTQHSGFRVLGRLFDTDRAGQVSGLSVDGGVAVGISHRDGDPPAPVRWWPDGRVESLGMLIDITFPEGRAEGVSADGNYVVGFTPGNRRGDSRAVRWDAMGVAQDLGVLPGLVDSVGWAISADGRVIGGSCRSNFTGMHVASVWTEEDGMMPLDEYLLGHGVPIPAGVRLLDCYSVSGDGMSFGGIAVDRFNVRVGFVATVPAPGTMVAFAGGVLACFRSRRHGLPFRESDGKACRLQRGPSCAAPGSLAMPCGTGGE
ncbi:MAG: hypothetical protein JNK25_09360 [Phycisphaerae bacterium]|nr:hypothetical protein [Phycisphaerae bacterium]